MNNNKRPQSASNKYPLQKYKDIESKHFNMKKTVQKTNFADFQNISGGSFNRTLSKDDVAIRIANNSQQENNDSKFLPLFASALLKTCGETTITYGIDNITYNTNTSNNVQFFDGGFYITSLCEGMPESNIEEPNQEIHQNEPIMYMDKAYYDAVGMLVYNIQPIPVLDCFRTDLIGKPVMKNDDDWKTYNDVLQNNNNMPLSSFNNPFCNYTYINNLDFKSLDDEALKTIARHFCKIFLFQMHDRKPENLLVFGKKQNKQIKPVFVECDFDDIKQNDGICLNILFGAHKGTLQGRTLDSMWKDRLNALANTQYKSFLTKIEGAGKSKTWSTIFKETIKEYTMTEDKITKIIQEVAKNSKYMNIPRNDLVTKISKKLNQFKEMCETPLEYDKQDILEKIPAIKDARKNTLKAINKFVKNKTIDTEKIRKIVDFELAKQDFGVGLKTKRSYSCNNKKATIIKNNVNKLGQLKE